MEVSKKLHGKDEVKRVREHLRNIPVAVWILNNNNNNNIYSWVKYLVFDIELVKYLETPPKKEKRFMSNN